MRTGIETVVVKMKSRVSRYFRHTGRTVAKKMTKRSTMSEVKGRKEGQCQEVYG